MRALLTGPEVPLLRTARPAIRDGLLQPAHRVISHVEPKSGAKIMLRRVIDLTSRATAPLQLLQTITGLDHLSL